MSKGLGLGGSGSTGSYVRGAIGRAGGAGGVAGRQVEGMRQESLSHARAAYRGATSTTAANRVAAHVSPVHIGVERTASGKPRVYIIDGRHRVQAAREAGATHIRAVVTVYGARGGQRASWTGLVRI